MALKSLLTLLRGAAEGTLKVMDIAAIVLLRLSNDVMEGSKEPIWKTCSMLSKTLHSPQARVAWAPEVVASWLKLE